MVKIKELVRINKRFGGTLINKSNLDFDVEKANEEKDIYKSNAYLMRGIINGHPFLDGNKKTASTIVLSRFKKHNIGCDKNKFERGIINIAKTNESSINNITRRLKRWCKKR